MSDERTGDTTNRCADGCTSDITGCCATDDGATGCADCRTLFGLRAGGQWENEATISIFFMTRSYPKVALLNIESVARN